MRRLAYCCALAVAASLTGAVAVPHAYAQLGPLSQFLHPPPLPGPPVARYVADGVASFVFDQTNDGEPMVQFQDTHEVVVLTRHSGPHGDVIFSNDIGEQVLRFSNLGGVTVYTSNHPEGAPAVLLTGVVTPIRLQGIRDGDVLFERERAISIRISRVFQREVGVDIPDLGPESWTLAADAINMTAQAFENNADRIRRENRLPHLDRILVVEGDKPDVLVTYDTLQITVAPKKGLAGRPSSARIVKAMFAKP